MGSKPNGKPPNRSPFLSLSLSPRSLRGHGHHTPSRGILTALTHIAAAATAAASESDRMDGAVAAWGDRGGQRRACSLDLPVPPSLLVSASRPWTGRDQTANSIGIDSRCAWVVARVRTYDGAPMEPALALAAPVGGLAWQALKPNKEKRTKLKARSASMCFCKSEHFTAPSSSSKIRDLSQSFLYGLSPHPMAIGITAPRSMTSLLAGQPSSLLTTGVRGGCIHACMLC